MGAIQRPPRVVVIGGGTGLSVMLRGLKKKPLQLTAVVTVADDGGSSGRLRQEMNMLPPGDIRNVLVALAEAEPLLQEVLQYRFQQGNGLAGHTLGNLLLAALNEITGDFVTGVKALSRVLAVRGKVLPASNQGVVLKAHMTDGSTVVGESLIPLSGKRIHRIELLPSDVVANQEALQEIEQADCLIVGPGSLYTSLLPNLLVTGITEAVCRSSALKVYICNVMTQPGETDGFTAVDHLQVIADHVGDRLFHTVVVNLAEIPEQFKQKYAEEGAIPVEPCLKALKEQGYRVVAEDLITYHTYLRHDSERLSDLIDRLVVEWMAKNK